MPSIEKIIQNALAGRSIVFCMNERVYGTDTDVYRSRSRFNNESDWEDDEHKDLGPYKERTIKTQARIIQAELKGTRYLLTLYEYDFRFELHQKEELEIIDGPRGYSDH